MYLVLTTAFLVMMSGVALGNWALWKMVLKINEVSGTEEFSWIGWNFQKNQNVWKRYRALEPSGRFAKLYVLGLALGFIGFVSIASTFGLLPHVSGR
jgi:hypothetical protein